MPFLYDRKETKSKITIVFKYQWLWYLSLIGLLILISIFPNSYWTIPIIVVVGAVQIAGKWKANKEIREAMSQDKVTISGSRFSFKNPVTVEIKK